MLHHIKMQGKPTNCEILHFRALCAQLRVRRACDLKSDNASSSALLFYPLSPNFIQIEATLLPKTPMQPERRLSPYVATVAGSANSLSVGPSGPNNDKQINMLFFCLATLIEVVMPIFSCSSTTSPPNKSQTVSNTQVYSKELPVMDGRERDMQS